MSFDSFVNDMMCEVSVLVCLIYVLLYSLFVSLSWLHRWLKQCHSIFDQDYKLTGRLRKKESTGCGYGAFQTLKIGSIAELREGHICRLRIKLPVKGKGSKEKTIYARIDSFRTRSPLSRDQVSYHVREF